MMPTWILGVVTRNGQPSSGETVTTSAPRNATTLPDGSYIMYHPPGSWTVSSGGQNKNVSVAEGEAKVVNFAL